MHIYYFSTIDSVWWIVLANIWANGVWCKFKLYIDEHVLGCKEPVYNKN